MKDPEMYKGHASLDIGYACVMRDRGGREFLSGHTFAKSRNKCKFSAQAINKRRAQDGLPLLEILRICRVELRPAESEQNAAITCQEMLNSYIDKCAELHTELVSMRAAQMFKQPATPTAPKAA